MIDPEEVICPPKIGPYVLKNDIGIGSFALVRIAVDETTGEKFAVKILPRNKISNEELEDRFEQEIRVLQQMKHPNITQMYDLIKDENNFYVFMELCPNGELFHIIVNRKFIPEQEAKLYLGQLASALAYVHSMGACHRDLKPENLLVGKDGKIKITDFGFSRFVGENGLCSTACGSPCYVSPECISGEPYDGTKSDVWSIGVIFFVMCTGRMPWTKRNQAKLFEQIQKGDYMIPNNLSEGCKDIIKKMMCVDPEKRISAEDILKEPYMQDSLPDYPSKTNMLGVTLKKVDQFFDRDYEEVSDDLSFEKISARSVDFTKIGRMIRHNTPPAIAAFPKLPPLAATQNIKKHNTSLSKRLVLPKVLSRQGIPQFKPSPIVVKRKL
jgi:5'-AMP-activated protein kinase catalytic alpha subunit